MRVEGVNLSLVSGVWVFMVRQVADTSYIFAVWEVHEICE